MVKFCPGKLKEVPDDEPLKQDSFLQEVDLFESEEEANVKENSKGDHSIAKAAPKLPGSICETHQIVLNDEWGTSETRVKTYQDGKRKQLTSKRRKRGKCLYCDDRNMAYYCLTCPPQKTSPKTLGVWTTSGMEQQNQTQAHSVPEAAQEGMDALDPKRGGQGKQ